MKKLFTILACAAAMVACENDEIVRQDLGDAIEFGNAFVDNATRVDYSTTDIPGFLVYGAVNGVNIYDGDNVTKGTTAYGDAWACTDNAAPYAPVTQYWIDGAAYEFAAVVGADKVNVATDDAAMPTSLEYNAAGQQDMLYKYVTAEGKPKDQNSIVSFTFTHLLAKAYFTVTNQITDTKYTYTISDVKVTNAFQKGVYSVNGDTGSWAGSSSDVAPTAFASIESVANGTPKKNAEVLLIPTANVGVSFTVTLYIGGKEVTSYDYEKAAVTTLEPNKVYNFNVVFEALDQIEFTVTEKPQWDEETVNKDVKPAKQ